MVVPDASRSRHVVGPWITVSPLIWAYPAPHAMADQLWSTLNACLVAIVVMGAAVFLAMVAAVRPKIRPEPGQGRPSTTMQGAYTTDRSE